MDDSAPLADALGTSAHGDEDMPCLANFAMLADGRVDELEGLLRQSAQWGQYLVTRNEELEAEIRKMKRQSGLDASRDSDQLRLEEQLNEDVQEALLRGEELEEEVLALKSELAAAHQALELEQSLASSLRLKADQMRHELEKRLEEDMFKSQESVPGDGAACSLADELGMLSMGAGPGPSACREAWPKEDEKELAENDVKPERGKNASVSDALEVENANLHEENRRLIAELRKLRASTVAQIEDSFHLSQKLDIPLSPDGNLLARRGSQDSNTSIDLTELEEHGERDAPPSTRQDNRALRIECRQLRKEVAGAEEWERQARKTTEAKQGLLQLHEALLLDSPSTSASEHGDSPSASASEQGSTTNILTTTEVQKIREAVVRAADAEAEARELLATKQEMLAEQEARLRESDQKCLKDVVTSVKSAFHHPTPCTGAKGNAVWHVIMDSA